MIVKICKHHGELTEQECYKPKDRPGYNCRKCRQDAVKRYHEKYPEKTKAMMAKAYKKYGNKERKKRQKWQQDWKKRTNYTKKYNKKCYNDLPDFYVRKKIADRSNLKHADIPKELVELKRAAILLKRAMKK